MDAMYNEDELIQLLQVKDRKAFDQLYAQYAAALYGVIYKIMSEDTRSQDVLQETFVKIWNSFDSYDHQKGRLYTWMINIARNTSIDSLRRHNRIAKSFEYRESVEHYQHISTEQRTDKIGLHKLVAGLKPDTRTIIDLVYYKGYTQLEASHIIDMPLGTVKTRLRTAMKSLRAHFADREVAFSFDEPGLVSLY